jgi:hypothetical protein
MGCSPSTKRREEAMSLDQCEICLCHPPYAECPGSDCERWKALQAEVAKLKDDADRLDWVEHNLMRFGEVTNETGTEKVRTWSIITACSDSLRETIDLMRKQLSH